MDEDDFNYQWFPLWEERWKNFISNPLNHFNQRSMTREEYRGLIYMISSDPRYLKIQINQRIIRIV